MSQTDAVFAGSIPAFYDRYLGPLLFEPYARDLAGRLANIVQGRVLETAAGTGILTRTLGRTLPEAVTIVATDLNQPMIDFAAAQPGEGRVTWRQADALSLPFEEKSFDFYSAALRDDKTSTATRGSRASGGERPGNHRQSRCRIWAGTSPHRGDGRLASAIARLVRTAWRNGSTS